MGDQYCKDFVCCGTDLENLHDLLQHFEENHVRVEDFEDDDDEDFEMDMTDDDMDMEGVPNPHQQKHLKGEQDRAGAGFNAFSGMSAFDTSVIRLRKLDANPLIASHPHLTGPQRANSISSSDPASRRQRPQQPQRQHSARDEFPGHVYDGPAQMLPYSFDGPTVVMEDGDTDMEDAEDEDGNDHPFSERQMNQMQQFQQFNNPHSSLLRPALARTSSGPPFLSSVGTVEPARLHSASSTPFNSRCASPSSDSGVSVHTVTAAPVVAPLRAPAPVTRVVSTADADGAPLARKYRCKVEGCEKTYKNPGGLKYHMQHGHAEDTGDPELNLVMQRPYQCTVLECGKRYKNLNGLKYHIEHAHANLLENAAY
ncbi:hypothetical protein HK101_011242 [Irineochytrium annulatum]|nr:hypothetical protein HK101_011242 [Irineochytrium annulatum]